MRDEQRECRPRAPPRPPLLLREGGCGARVAEVEHLLRGDHQMAGGGSAEDMGDDEAPGAIAGRQGHYSGSLTASRVPTSTPSSRALVATTPSSRPSKSSASMARLASLV